MSAWTAQGPWMSQQAMPRVVDSISAGGWKMKVIRSLDRKLRAYQPGYAEDSADEPSNATQIVVREGVRKRCKNERKTIRVAKQRSTAKSMSLRIRSFTSWLKDQESRKEKKVQASTDPTGTGLAEDTNDQCVDGTHNAL